MTLIDAVTEEDETARLFVLHGLAVTVPEFREGMKEVHPDIRFARLIELARKYRGLGQRPPTHDAATGKPFEES